MEIIDAVVNERLSEVEVQWSRDATVCVVLASGGVSRELQDRSSDFRVGFSGARYPSFPCRNIL